jgi:MFS family permease
MASTATTGTPTSFLSTRHGKLILALVCAAGFLDVIDTTIVNIALPSIRDHVDFSVQSLQWIASGYLLTYGGFLLLGGRAADLLGRRRVFVAGTLLFGLSSLVCGLAGTEAVLISARLAQGLGAAMMTPAALSILTTSFSGETDRSKAIGLWSATIPLGAVVGVLAGGLLTEGPGWRWVFFVNVPVCGLVLAAAFRLLPDDRRRAPARAFDAIGAVLSTGGMLLLVYALVQAPDAGWADIRTIAELAAAGSLLAVFVAAELRHRNPLFPLSIFRIKGLAAADATQVIAQAGFYAMFFFVTLYMQNVLGFSPITAGAAYVPVTIGVAMATGVASKLLPRTGARPIIITGASRRGRRLLALPPTRAQQLRRRRPARAGGHGARTRRHLRRRPDRRQRRSARRQGRTRRRPGQRVSPARQRPRIGRLLRDSRQPHPTPARIPRHPNGRAHRRLPARPHRWQPLPRRRSTHRGTAPATPPTSTARTRVLLLSGSSRTPLWRETRTARGRPALRPGASTGPRYCRGTAHQGHRAGQPK